MLRESIGCVDPSGFYDTRFWFILRPCKEYMYFYIYTKNTYTRMWEKITYSSENFWLSKKNTYIRSENCPREIHTYALTFGYPSTDFSFWSVCLRKPYTSVNWFEI